MTPKEFALEIAREAGGIIRANFGIGMKKDWKADDTPVTATDLAVNKRLIEGVKQHFPGHGVRGEEESFVVEGASHTWVCDPVDGTIPFSHGIPVCCFSLGLVEASTGASVLGVIYDPLMDRMVWAERGAGAFLNGQPIHVSADAPAERTIIGVPLWTNTFLDPGKLVNDIYAHGYKTMDTGSHSYMSMLVALGEFAGVIYAGHGAHDGAAAVVIIKEAGGTVTDLYGAEQRYDAPLKGFIGSNGVVHEELLGRVRQSLT